MLIRPIVAALACGLLGLSACQQLIALGDEPELVLDETPPGSMVFCAPTTSAEQEAFLVRSAARVSPACSECLDSRCCAEHLACGTDPVCIATAECLRYCYEATCVTECLQEMTNDATTGFVNCSIGSCVTACLPQGECLRLGTECCQNIEEPLLEEACSVIAQRGDDDSCLQARLETFADECLTESAP